MFSRTNFQKKNSFSTRSGLALLISSMFVISACAPAAPQLQTANGAFPQQVADSSGTPIAVGGYDLTSLQAADWAALRGTYGGTIHHYQSARQDYTITLSERTLQGRRFAYAEFRSNGDIGQIGIGAYMFSEPVASTWNGTKIRFITSEIPGEMLESWVSDPVVLVMELTAVTAANGSKVFDPTQSSIYILDCAVAPGSGICSNVYPYEVAGFESLGRR